MIRIAGFLILVFLLGCTPDDPSNSQELISSSVLFPLDIDHSISYEVSEFIFTSRGQIDTLSYQLRETVVDEFIDDTGATVHVVDRFVKPVDGGTWTYQQSWQSMITDNQAIRIEDNRRYIKLRLPIRQNDTWDANALFDDSAPIVIGNEPIDYYKNWQSKITQMNESVKIVGQTYNEVTSVSLADYENNIELRRVEEKYADGIGLIYRKIEVLDTQCFDACANESWSEKAESGHIYIQHIINQ